MSISAVDGVSTTFVPVRVDAGVHRLTIDAPPVAGFHLPDRREFTFKAEKCVRYWLAAQRPNALSHDFALVIDHAESVPGCNPTSGARRRRWWCPAISARSKHRNRYRCRSGHSAGPARTTAANPVTTVFRRKSCRCRNPFLKSKSAYRFPTRRGVLKAVDDVSFSIAPGEVLGVVGESGAGKSLTGAAIIGLLEPPGRVASGQILLNGQRIDNLPYEQMRKIRGRQIGAIFQDPLTSLNPLYTVGRQLVETIQTHLS